jgi:hypothetical protein
VLGNFLGKLERKLVRVYWITENPPDTPDGAMADHRYTGILLSSRLLWDPPSHESAMVLCQARPNRFMCSNFNGAPYLHKDGRPIADDVFQYRINEGKWPPVAAMGALAEIIKSRHEANTRARVVRCGCSR